MQRLGLFALVSILVLTGATTAPGNAEPGRSNRTSAVAYRCVLDAYGQVGSGRIKYRRVINDHIQIDKTTSRSYSWTPVSWMLTELEGWPDRERSRQLVPSTDGRVRYVETAWRQSEPGLRVTVLKVVGTGFPTRLIAGANNTFYWIDTDGVLRKRTWTGRRFTAVKALPVTVPGATSLSVIESERVHIYVTDRSGALHLITDSAEVTQRVLTTTGFASTTGLKAGDCMSPDFSTVRPFIGLLSVDRTAGVAKFRRHLRPEGTAGGTLTAPARVRPADWTWKRLG